MNALHQEISRLLRNLVVVKLISKSYAVLPMLIKETTQVKIIVKMIEFIGTCHVRSTCAFLVSGWYFDKSSHPDLPCLARGRMVDHCHEQRQRSDEMSKP